METQSRFDLNAAIQIWRQELAAQPDLTPDARRELETHVCDTVAELQKRGLSDEESFWLARRRVGQPCELNQEFRKTGLANFWRERVLWMACGLLSLALWQLVAGGIYGAFLVYYKPYGVTGLLVNQLVTYWPLPLALIAAFLARSRFVKKPAVWFSLIRSRRHFFVVASASFLALQCCCYEMQVILGNHLFDGRVFSHRILSVRFSEWLYSWLNKVWLIQHFDIGTLKYLAITTSWPLTLIAIIAWLLPPKESQALKRA